MQHRLILPVVCCFAAMAGAAEAAPLSFDKSEAVADARRDLGTGICGSVTNFNSPKVASIPEATMVLNLPRTDARVAGREAKLFDNINLRMTASPQSAGEFTEPMSFDADVPFGNGPGSMPMSLSGANIAMRLRGYLNVTSTNGGQPIGLGINCNDACELHIGKSKTLVLTADAFDNQYTATRVRQVIFKDTGMYPVEIIYFQNTAEGYMEWARTTMPAMGEDDIALNIPPGFDKSRWSVIKGTDLFSSVLGTNPACQECGAPGMDCAGGNYCGDGLCQPCMVADHCGPTCMTCPADARLCNAGKCVQCTADAMCPPGTSCVDGKCGPPTMCTTDADCKSMGKVCDPDMRVCVIPPTACTTDASCPAGQICDGMYCRTKCGTNSQCGVGQYCDNGAGVCKPSNRFQYEGGLGGCSVTPAAPNATGSTSAGSMALIALSLMGLGLLARRRYGRSGLALRGASRATLAALAVFFLLGPH